jgi:tetratricopeptide (TPR) repeat protein
VLLLHSFQYREAREEFRAAQKLQPAFAMAYWGEAMTYNEPLWFAQDAASARAVLQRVGPTAKVTDREAEYVQAIRILYGSGRKEDRDFEYATAMRRLHERFPDDNEAAAFYALALLGTSHSGRDFRTYMRAAAVAEEILARNPEHPGALHYAIHCYDDPVHAPLGLRAARAYAQIAPESSHALHMPSHIFFAMGMWNDAARSNEAAFRASQNSASRDGGRMEGAGYHALWWLQYARLQQGQFAEARKALSEMERLAMTQPSSLARFHLIQMRAMYSIETGEPYQASETVSAAAGTHFFAAGLSALNRGEREVAERALKDLRLLSSPTRPAGHADHLHAGDAQALSVMENELAAMLLMSDGKSREAIERMKAAVAIEDKTPYEFGPPSSPKPAHELLGEMLLRLDQPQLARVQFELALFRAPKRALSMLGLARALAAMGNRSAARAAYSELREMWRSADAALLKAIDDSLARLQQATP